MIEDSMLGSEPPSFDPATALQLAESEYGLAGTASPLESERDQNFRLLTPDGRQFVLKIANLKEHPAVIDFQTRALQHIAQIAPELKVPRTIRTTRGLDSCTIPDKHGRIHLVRLISWLDGIPVKQLPASRLLLRSMGRNLALLGAALKNFSHAASANKSLWDLSHAGELAGLLPSVREPQLQDLLGGIFDHYLDRVLPVLQESRAQVIHGDLNAENVLAGVHDLDQVSGVIDFGDMVHTALVNDVAVAAAYQIAPSGDPLSDCLEFISAYHEVTPLESAEAGMLLDLMQTRLACSYVIWSWRAEQFSEQPVFLQRALDFARTRLEHLAAEGVKKQSSRVIAACNRQRQNP